MDNMKTLKEWELAKGIEIKTKKNIIKCTSENRFIKLIRDNYITIKTDKGLKYYEKINNGGRR